LTGPLAVKTAGPSALHVLGSVKGAHRTGRRLETGGKPSSISGDAMPHSTISTHAELVSAVNPAWEELLSFLQAVNSGDAATHDSNGWTVKDHVAHIAVWEDSVAILFRGGLRHKALGIDEASYTTSSFDQINEVIRGQFETIPLAQAIRQLEQVHSELMTRVMALSEADLKTSVRDYFPQAPRTDDRPMITFIYDNTADHFIEHLSWMRELLGSAT
jgi:hypothetical protein